jgi:PadR family transcriptional regulator, regulatory protein PadR
MGLTNTPSALLPGTLELLILRALTGHLRRGYGIVSICAWHRTMCSESGRARSIRRFNGSCSVVGSRLSGASRRTVAAPVTYALTPAGRKQPTAERAEFDRTIGAIQRVLGPIRELP